MKSNRILSIDIFRGLTIFLMVFVNDLAGVANIPAWMKHVAADVDGMTFVDVVFPAFLFIVGMAIPFAVSKRMARGQTELEFWRHVLYRTLGLWILGIYMVNSAEMNSEASLLPHTIWAPLLYISAVFIWNRYPEHKATLGRALRIMGMLILVLLYFSYRKGPDEQLTGMTPSWWGILGLIGWAYLYAMILYRLVVERLLLLILVFLLLFLLDLALWSESFQDQLHWLKGQSGNLAHTLITLAGIICALFLRQNGIRHNAWSKMFYMVLFGLLLCLGAYLSRPLGGISKIGATPSWALYSAAICCFVFPLVYWLVDLKGIKNWANFLKPAGENPLLTYIIPPFIYGLLGFSFWPDFLSSGFAGFVRSVLFSLLILTIAAWLTKKKIRLQF